MRAVSFSIPVALSAAIVLPATLLAGCSNAAPSAAAVPPGSAGVSQATRGASMLPRTPLRLLQMQAEGKLAGPVPQRVLRSQLRQLGSGARPIVPAHKGSVVGIWTAMTSYDYVFGASAAGKVVVSAIDTQTQTSPGYYPVGVKVDHSQNLWVANQYDAAYTAPITQEYNAAGQLQAAYVGGCSVPASECGYFDGYGFDTAVSATTVFQSDTTAYQETCTPTCTVAHGGGYEFWPLGSASATPGLVILPIGKPVYTVYYLDVDNAGNLWFDYYGCSSSACGYGIGEIVNPTSPSYSFVSIEPPGFLAFPGGVYVSNGGNTVNVVDQDNRTISQFALSGAITATLGPTGLLGNPVGLGFNSVDTKVIVGDAQLDALDVGALKTDKWHQVKALLFIAPLEGAAATPSDK